MLWRFLENKTKNIIEYFNRQRGEDQSTWREREVSVPEPGRGAEEQEVCRAEAETTREGKEQGTGLKAGPGSLSPSVKMPAFMGSKIKTSGILLLPEMVKTMCNKYIQCKDDDDDDNDASIVVKLSCL